MPRQAFDTLAAIARLNTESTSHHRERWPSLDWVWDELDMLRECWVTQIDHDDHEGVKAERDTALDERDKLRDVIKAVLDEHSTKRDAMLREALK